MSICRTIVNARGQIVIPAELRERFGLRKGTRVAWSEEGGCLVLTVITERRLDEIMGFLKPVPGEPSVFEKVFVERERERTREK